MIWNEKYRVYVNKDGVILSYFKKDYKLYDCSYKINSGYIKAKSGLIHRIVWETFIGEIPEGYEIDHIDSNKENNALSNLQLLTHKENINKLAKEGRKYTPTTAGKIISDFGRKFFEHYGLKKQDNNKLYQREKVWYHNHNHKCRWE